MSTEQPRIGSAGAEPSTGPTGAERNGVEPTGAERNGVEPTGVERNGVEPTGAEPSGAEASGVEAGGAEASGAEASGAEAGGAEPTGTDSSYPVPTEAAPTGVEPDGHSRGGQAGDGQPFHSASWRPVEGLAFTDITYHRSVLPGPVPGRTLGAVRIAFDRPEVLNAFRPHTVDELYRALDHARMTPDVGVVLLTGNGPGPEGTGAAGKWSFCSGGDQRIRGRSGYQYASSQATASGDETASSVDAARVKAEGGRLHILEVQRLIRTMPKVVIALVGGWAAGGGHSLHVVSDLTIASREHARFKQTDADVGSFDAGYGSAYLARMVGQKFAREIFFLGRTYTADDMHRMGAVNIVAEHAQLESTAIQVAREILGKSPQAQRMLKFAFNLVDDGLTGQQVFAGEATRLAYMTDEAVEGRDQFLQKRDPDWSPFPWYF